MAALAAEGAPLPRVRGTCGGPAKYAECDIGGGVTHMGMDISNSKPSKMTTMTTTARGIMPTWT